MYDKKAILKYRAKNKEKFNDYMREYKKNSYTKEEGKRKYKLVLYKKEATIFRNILFENI
jgi:hypothetical protein